jgi:hypothetical protein
MFGCFSWSCRMLPGEARGIFPNNFPTLPIYKALLPGVKECNCNRFTHISIVGSSAALSPRRREAVSPAATRLATVVLTAYSKCTVKFTTMEVRF